MKKLFLSLAVFVMAICANAQTNQYFWYQGNLMMGNPIAQIDSVTFGEGEPADTLHILLPRTIIKTVHDTVYVTIHDTVCPNDLPDGALPGEFSVSATKKVRFSKGNLQYQASTDTWRFAEHQYDYVGNATLGTVYENEVKCNNALISTTYSGWIDCFGFSTSKTYYGVSTSTNASDYYGEFIDWGNTIGEGWYTLSKSEWTYLLNNRTGFGVSSSELHAFATIDGIKGIVFLPDTYWQLTHSVAINPSQLNNFTMAQWTQLEADGVVFLPAAGYRNGKYVAYVQNSGDYYASSSSSSTSYNVDGLQFDFSTDYLSPDSDNSRDGGRTVRLVQDVE